MIPGIAHFIWFGDRLLWVNALSIISAARRGGFSKLVLHTEHDLADCEHWDSLRQLNGFEHRILDHESLFSALPGGRGADLLSVYKSLTQPAAKANLIRATLLALEGGVYLDMDTITVASLEPLRAQARVFFGLERVALPYKVRASRSLVVWITAGTRLLIRDFFRRLPGGWKFFRFLEPYFPAAANNAILACEPGHPFMLDLLDRMVSTPLGRRTARYALGTHLLQQALSDCPDSGVKAHCPEVFYPLGPEISEHWFRRGASPGLDQALLSETRVVHWYASVRTKAITPEIDEAYILKHRDRQLFSELVCRVLGL